MATKQVIAIRADLKIRRGKEGSQIAHAASDWLREYALECHRSAEKDLPCAILTPDEFNWCSGNYRKIVVKATSEKQLRDLHQEAQARGLTSHLIIDDGLTEVPPKTVTALAIGPHEERAFVGLTDHLPLY